MTKVQAAPYISFAVDDALSERNPSEAPANARLVGWQCGFEPLFVAVWSYLQDTKGNPSRIDEEEAEELARDLLEEKGWFSGDSTEADYVI